MSMDLMTTKEAAHRLNVDVSTLSRWAHTGKVEPAVRLANGHMLWDPDEIEALAVEMRVAP